MDIHASVTGSEAGRPFWLSLSFDTSFEVVSWVSEACIASAS